MRAHWGLPSAFAVLMRTCEHPQFWKLALGAGEGVEQAVEDVLNEGMYLPAGPDESLVFQIDVSSRMSRALWREETDPDLAEVIFSTKRGLGMSPVLYIDLRLPGAGTVQNLVTIHSW
ncbi:hypothetical protein OH76DRAFT_1406692 [Lentinus brumalis]|uniref:Uncharacterized protein n=1 Tax=Lentinus brumalis TaxID=2498619 RepID=A0A371D268_9APHY|nr:hypothetical protein OH76DRAFT_1406692 [Polyporus brumalis]